MRFSRFSNGTKAGRLNEAVRFEAGDLAFYTDKNGPIGIMILGSLNGDGSYGGYLAVGGNILGYYTPKNINKFNIAHLDLCNWIDSSGKVEGKYPIRKFNGSWDEFLAKCEEYY